MEDHITFDKTSKKSGYVYFKEHLGPGVYGSVSSTIRLAELIPELGEKEINLDFDENGNLVGIEILVD